MVIIKTLKLPIIIIKLFYHSNKAPSELIVATRLKLNCFKNKILMHQVVYLNNNKFLFNRKNLSKEFNF